MYLIHKSEYLLELLGIVILIIIEIFCYFIEILAIWTLPFILDVWRCKDITISKYFLTVQTFFVQCSDISLYEYFIFDLKIQIFFTVQTFLV